MRQALFICGGVALLITTVSAQTKPGVVAPKAQATLKTPWGDPDFGGVWNVASGTPLERPAAFAGREFLTDEELERAERDSTARANADRRDSAGLTDLRREHNDFWFEKRKTVLTRRTSLIFDPPDGKLPPLTPEAAKKPLPPPDESKPADAPEDRSLGERCLVGNSNGPPFLVQPSAINEQLLGQMWNFQIVQTPNYVVIVSEYITQVRIIPLDRRPRLPPATREWAGDARARWDGDTLIVETANFSAKRLFLGLSAENLRVVERFTRSGADQIDYRFTIDDTTRWTRPWSAVVPIEKSDGPLYEFACHEGNYGLRNILSIKRALEREAAEQAPR